MANSSIEEDTRNQSSIPVRVAVRIRPLVVREKREGCQECLDVSSGTPQVVVRGTEKAFTFDYVFGSDSTQDYIYDKSVAKMVNQLFKGYNVTILAYGQTGSGKTHSMGTNFVRSRDDESEMGIIPRAVQDIFSGIADRKDEDIIVKVSFIELYKENLYDLLNTKSRQETVVDIREDPRGGIKISGLTEIPVLTLEETMKCLEHGALNRATGATAMNARSSRSHAIFSLHIEVKNYLDSDNIISAKFHLVDLAGSERAKKTGATGERFREGVNINKGLLALGNVISALCGEGQRGGHVPYRDSKLTRLLQDSLGGNSHTVMLACVSPADSNLEETLSTLRYADRARKIKNKPVINRDPQAAELTKLRQQVQQLQVQLLASQADPGSRISTSSSDINSILDHNRMLEEENEKLTLALQTAIDENTSMAEKAIMAEMARDRLKMHLEELRAQTGNTVDVFNKTLDVTVNPQFGEQINLVKELQKKIINLQAEQQKNERAIVNHELSRHSVSTNTLNDDELTIDEQSHEGTSLSPIKGEFGAAYTLRQAKLNEQLQDLNKALVMKEELMSKMSTNDNRFVAMKTNYEKTLKEFEDQVNILMKEKDELNQQLRNASHNASNKIAEQRRKRLQELEGQIGDFKKKIVEQNKLLKIKEQSEQKVNKLSFEIQSMKAVRVKLIRQMKDDNEKFRRWKAQKDREVTKLKEEDRKKQFQIVKMERLHTKQQNVLKRKMEEAVAINKRLKDALALQKVCQEKRASSRDVGGVSCRVKAWLDGELEVVTVKKQAKQSLETLMDDRKTISEQLNKVKRQLSRGELSYGMHSELKKKLASLESDLEMRTAQINDIQTKVVDENDAANKKMFDSVQTMVEAKCAMQYLFDVATENLTNVAAHESDINELNSQYEDVCHNMDELEKELKQLKENHQNELSKLSREHEDKILFLLRQMPKSQVDRANSSEISEENADENKEAVLIKRLKFQEEELVRLSNLHELLQQKTVECEELQIELKELKKNNSDFVIAPLPSISLAPPSDDNVPKKLEKSKKSIHKSATQILDWSASMSMSEDEEVHAEDSDSEQEIAINDDPDWKKTPLFRRIRQIITKRGKQSSNEDGSSDESSKKSGIKRSSAGDVRCGCSRDCSTKQCTCQKNGSICCVSCKCNALKCVNRNTPNTSVSASETSSSKNETLLNSTFDVLGENSQSKRIRLSENDAKVPKKENVDPYASELTPQFSAKDINVSMPPLT